VGVPVTNYTTPLSVLKKEIPNIKSFEIKESVFIKSNTSKK
jgi:hypothetical protein